MTVKQLLKQLKKEAKKRGIIDEEIAPLYSGGSHFLMRTTDENGSTSFWKVGYDQVKDNIIPNIRS